MIDALRPGPGRAAARLWLAAPVGFGLLSLALGQDANFDLRNYHWYNPFALLNGRHGFDANAALMQTYFSPALDLPWYLLSAVAPAPILGFVIGAVHGINLPLLVAIAHRLLPVESPGRRWLAALGLASLGMAGAAAVSEIGTVMNDLVVSIGVLGSLLLVLRAWPDLAGAPLARAGRRAAWAGVPVGLAIGAKLVAAPYGVALVAAFAALPGSWPRRVGLAACCAAGAAVPMLLLLGPWCWHTWVHTGNPVYPFFNGLFHAPGLGPGGNRDMRWFPHGLGEWLGWPIVFALDPLRLSEIPLRDFRLALAYVLLPALLLVRLLLPGRRALPPAAAYLFLLMAVGYLCWLAVFSYGRYSMPLAMLAPLAVALALLALPLPRRAAWAGVLAMAAILVGTTRYPDWGRIPWSTRFVEAAPPPLARPGDSIVLLAGAPLAFIVPSFPASVPFLQLEPPAGIPWEGDTPWHRMIGARLAARAAADLYVAFGQPSLARLPALLAAYGLALGPEAGCRPVPSNFSGPDWLRLCPVVRVPG
jgi:hypothetical protein